MYVITKIAEVDNTNLSYYFSSVNFTVDVLFRVISTKHEFFDFIIT